MIWWPIANSEVSRDLLKASPGKVISGSRTMATRSGSGISKSGNYNSVKPFLHPVCAPVCAIDDLRTAD